MEALLLLASFLRLVYGGAFKSLLPPPRQFGSRSSLFHILFSRKYFQGEAKLTTFSVFCRC